jgi:hypothetical protein
MAEGTAVLAKSEGDNIGETNTTPNSIQEVPIVVPCYQNFKLKKGDNDKSKIWGGATQTDAGTWVKDLQQDLNDFGAYIGKLDGDFGKDTEDALKRFQWNALNIKRRLVDNVSTDVEITFKGSVSGEMDDETCTEIKLWRNAKYVSTGNLARVLISSFSNFKRGSMTQLRPTEFTADEIEIDRDFYDGLTALNTAASANSIILSINHVMRVDGVTLASAVVTPATKSQHKIGHGIDGNMIDGPTNMGKAAFIAGTETLNAKNFIEAAKASGLRWGGNFAPKTSERFDPIHFDLQVPADSDTYDYKFFFNQRQMSLNQPVPVL